MESGNETLPDTLENLQQFESGTLDNPDTGILATETGFLLQPENWDLGTWHCDLDPNENMSWD